MKRVLTICTIIFILFSITACNTTAIKDITEQLEETTENNEEDAKSIDEIAKAIKSFKKSAGTTFVSKDELITHLKNGERGIFICSESISEETLKKYIKKENTIAYSILINQTTVMVLPRIPKYEVIKIDVQDLITQ